MRYCAAEARAIGVQVGAHPGWPDHAGRGRSELPRVSPDQLARLVDEQTRRLAAIANDAGVRLHHVKLHGAIYHRVEADGALAAAYVGAVQARWPEAILYGRAGGAVVLAACEARMVAWAEAFLDRSYREDGTLVPRGEPNALLVDRDEILARVDGLLAGAGIRTVHGTWLPIVAQTLCVHSDTPGAIQLLRAVRDRLGSPAGARGQASSTQGSL